MGPGRGGGPAYTAEQQGVIDRGGQIYKELCFSCHGDLAKGMQAGKSKHAPVVAAECTKCHSPHTSKVKGLLLAEAPDICLTCHKALKARMEKEKTHPPAIRDCRRCHRPHFSAEPSLIVQPLQTLCGECHDLKGAEFVKAHINIKASLNFASGATPRVIIPDVHFGEVPISFGSRQDYGSFSLTFEADTVKVISN